MGSPVSVCRDIRLGGWGSVLGVCDRGARLAARVASATTTLAALKHYSNCQPKNDALAGVFWVGGCCSADLVVFCCVVLCSVPFRPSAAPAPCRATPRTSLPPAAPNCLPPHHAAPSPAPRIATHCHATAPRRPPRIAPPPASVPAVCSCPDIPASNLGAPPPATQSPRQAPSKKIPKIFWLGDRNRGVKCRCPAYYGSMAHKPKTKECSSCGQSALFKCRPVLPVSARLNSQEVTS